MRRGAALDARGIRYVDAGTSGGVWGADRGYCLMVGGTPEAVAHIEPILRALAPGEAGIAPSRGRDGKISTAHLGYLHCGPIGAGHFVKMIHNGIEYGMMQAFAEGFDIMRHAGDETLAPDHRYSLDLADIAELWRRGSVVSSWLLDLSAIALAEDADLAEYTGFVQDSGEGRWTILAAIEEAVPAEVLVGLVVRALPVAPGPHVCREDAVGDAEAVRRPRRAQEELIDRASGSAPRDAKEGSGDGTGGAPIVGRHVHRTWVDQQPQGIALTASRWPARTARRDTPPTTHGRP